MTRPKIYISGPISLGNRNQHFYYACEAQRLLMLMGYAPLNPMQSITLPFAWEPGDLGHGEWLEVDLEWVECADAVLRLPGRSKGADMECDHAREMGIPIVYNLEGVLNLWKTADKDSKKMMAEQQPWDWVGGDPLGESTEFKKKERDCKDVDERAGQEGGTESALPASSTSIQELLNSHDSLCQEAKAIMVNKNSDYTAGSQDPFANFRASEAMGASAVQGVLVRIVDKLQRIKSFDSMGELKVKDEGVRDSCIDVINYAILVHGLLKEKTKKGG